MQCVSGLVFCKDWSIWAHKIYLQIIIVYKKLVIHLISTLENKNWTEKNIQKKEKKKVNNLKTISIW